MFEQKFENIDDVLHSDRISFLKNETALPLLKEGVMEKNHDYSKNYRRTK